MVVSNLTSTRVNTAFFLTKIRHKKLALVTQSLGLSAAENFVDCVPKLYCFVQTH